MLLTIKYTINPATAVAIASPIPIERSVASADCLFTSSDVAVGVEEVAEGEKVIGIDDAIDGGPVTENRDVAEDEGIVVDEVAKGADAIV